MQKITIRNFVYKSLNHTDIDKYLAFDKYFVFVDSIWYHWTPLHAKYLTESWIMHVVFMYFIYKIYDENSFSADGHNTQNISRFKLRHMRRERVRQKTTNSKSDPLSDRPIIYEMLGKLPAALYVCYQQLKCEFGGF